MTKSDTTARFNQQGGAAYKNAWAKLAPTRDALHLLMQSILLDLPADTRVLCVGVGTGSELLALAEAFPTWRFTAVEPATAMLDVCRTDAEATGIADRCTFHEGYLETLPEAEPFDVATSILVSQFLTDIAERRAFFQAIAQRLRPSGYLIASDIAGDFSLSKYQELREVWKLMLRVADISPENAQKSVDSWETAIAVLPVAEVEALLASAGFSSPILFAQSLLIHSWYARRSDETV